MKKPPGRPSAASLTVVPLAIRQRPKPPKELNPEQAAEWIAIVDAKPADWFDRANQAMLVNYIRHVTGSRRIARAMEAVGELDPLNEDAVKLHGRLSVMMERHARMSASLATKLRLTQQARYRPETAARRSDNQPTTRRPWEPRVEDDEPA